MNIKLCLKKNMSWCAAYISSDSKKNNPGKTLFIFSKNECTKKACLAAINWKEGTLPKSIYCYRLFLVIVNVNHWI